MCLKRSFFSEGNFWPLGSRFGVEPLAFSVRPDTEKAVWVFYFVSFLTRVTFPFPKVSSRDVEICTVFTWKQMVTYHRNWNRLGSSSYCSHTLLVEFPSCLCPLYSIVSPTHSHSLSDSVLPSQDIGGLPYLPYHLLYCILVDSVAILSSGILLPYPYHTILCDGCS